jgi:NADH-quinone oxidoreductase subunit E
MSTTSKDTMKPPAGAKTTKPLNDILRRHKEQRGGGLIAILEEIQGAYGYLPENALRTVAEETGASLVDVYGVASFFKAFSLKPRGKHLVCACVGTACHVRGAQLVARQLEQDLGVAAGETTPDKQFTLETVNCLGACALGPVVVVDGHYYPHVRHDRTQAILDRARGQGERLSVGADRRIFPIVVRCPRCNHTLMAPAHPLDGHPSIHITMSFASVHGWLRLSSLYGSYTIESEVEIPTDTVVHLFCPHCHTELIGSADCADCGAPMVPMSVGGGGVVQICSRRGCKGHILDIGDHALA